MCRSLSRIAGSALEGAAFKRDDDWIKKCVGELE